MNKDGKNDEMDNTAASLSSQKVVRVDVSKSSYLLVLLWLEGPEIIKILIIFYFTCTTSTLTCITLFTLFPQHITPRAHAYTNTRTLRYIPAHMYNMPR